MKIAELLPLKMYPFTLKINKICELNHKKTSLIAYAASASV